MTIIDIFVADIQLWLQFWHYLYKEDYVGHFLSIFQEYCTIVVVYAIMSVRLWNFKGGGSKNGSFLPKNRCILRIRGVPDRQKLGMILEKKIPSIFDIENYNL